MSPLNLALVEQSQSLVASQHFTNMQFQQMQLVGSILVQVTSVNFSKKLGSDTENVNCILTLNIRDKLQEC